MVDEAPTKTAGEGKLVVSLIAGALVFYVCIAIVSVVADAGLSPGSGTYIGAWFLGAGLSSAFGVEVAKRVAPNFYRIGLIVLMVAPIALLAVGMFFAAPNFSSKTMVAVLSAFLGTAIGLGVTFRDLMKSNPDAKWTSRLRSLMNCFRKSRHETRWPRGGQRRATMRKLLILVLGLAGLVVSEPSRADQIVLQCQILSGAKNPFGKADKVVIDPEKNYAALRVARTMGTNDEESWDFTTQAKPGIDDRFTVKSFADDGPFYGGGVRAGSAQAFQLVKGILTWTSLHEDKIDTMRWRCR